MSIAESWIYPGICVPLEYDVTDIPESLFPVHVDGLTPESFDPRRLAHKVEIEALIQTMGKKQALKRLTSLPIPRKIPTRILN
jgi:hypothetical protein